MRPTYITGMVTIGTKARDITIRWDGKRYLAETVKGALVDPWAGEWRTLARTRKAAKSTVKGDKRFSGEGPAMFAVPLKNLTTRSGKAKGQPVSFEVFALSHLRKGGVENWGTETFEDRFTDMVGVLTQSSWPVSGDDLD